MIIFCDIDGTIADSSHRVRNKSGDIITINHKDLEHQFDELDIEYYLNPLNVLKDKEYENSAFVLTELKRKKNEIIYLTGRSLGMRDATMEWLWKLGFPYGRVVCCRQEGFDKTSVYEVKKPFIEAMMNVAEITGSMMYEDDWDETMAKGCVKYKNMQFRKVISKEFWYKEEKILRKARII